MLFLTKNILMYNILLSDNIEVEITKIYQMKTYDSLIEGTANKELNDDILVDIKQRAKRIFYRSSYYVMDPRVTEDDDFPPYTIILELMVFNTFQDPDKDYSALTVICFQDEFAFPINEENLIHLRQIPFGLLWREYRL